MKRNIFVMLNIYFFTESNKTLYFSLKRTCTFQFTLKELFTQYVSNIVIPLFLDCRNEWHWNQVVGKILNYNSS